MSSDTLTGGTDESAFLSSDTSTGAWDSDELFDVLPGFFLAVLGHTKKIFISFSGKTVQGHEAFF